MGGRRYVGVNDQHGWVKSWGKGEGLIGNGCSGRGGRAVSLLGLVDIYVVAPIAEQYLQTVQPGPAGDASFTSCFDWSACFCVFRRGVRAGVERGQFAAPRHGSAGCSAWNASCWWFCAGKFPGSSSWDYNQKIREQRGARFSEEKP